MHREGTQAQLGTKLPAIRPTQHVEAVERESSAGGIRADGREPF
jgi:hypothetical protein